MKRQAWQCDVCGEAYDSKVEADYCEESCKEWREIRRQSNRFHAVMGRLHDLPGSGDLDSLSQALEAVAGRFEREP